MDLRAILDQFSTLYALSGLAVGIIVGMTGVGGGSLMTPLLVLLFGIHPATAVGTDLLYAGLTKMAGTAVHRRHGSVDWRVVGTLAAGSIPASILTIWGLGSLGLNTSRVSAVISILLGYALVLTAISLLFRTQLLKLAQSRPDLSPSLRTGLTFSTGVLLGFLVSITSVGAGAIGVTALYFLYPRLSARSIVGSDIAHAVPLTLVAGAGHWWLGSIDWPLLLSLLVGSIPGIMIGSYATAHVPEGFLRGLLAIILVVVGARLIIV